LLAIICPKPAQKCNVTRTLKAWIPELIALAGPDVTETYIDFFCDRNKDG